MRKRQHSFAWLVTELARALGYLPRRKRKAHVRRAAPRRRPVTPVAGHGMPRVGDWWVDLDKRFNGRKVRVVRIEGDRVVVKSDRAVSRIRRSRFVRVYRRLTT